MQSGGLNRRDDDMRVFPQQYQNLHQNCYFDANFNIAFKTITCAFVVE
jgi:hypothetical protein